MKLDSTHPSAIVSALAKRLAPDTRFELSIYEYEPQSILDTRQSFEITAAEFNNDIIESVITRLPPNKELAFHSIIRYNKKKYHLPMIDFGLPQDQIKLTINSLQRVLSRQVFNELTFYDSGRSCHAYGLKLMSHSEWIEFMGRLLLVSHPNEDQLIDIRWIGHRLMSGFSSLRWSANTSHYLSYPVKIPMNSIKSTF